jgi:gluconokinase
MKEVSGMTKRLIVMGPSGVGKTTVGVALAQAIDARFVDADDLHPAANVEKMRRGEPLNDDDRWPWLDRVADAIAQARREDRSLVVACSALKKIYRERLRGADPELVIVVLSAARDVLEQRLKARTAHFMPSSLVASQLATLELPGPDEYALALDATRPVDDLVAEVLGRLS